MSLVKGILHTLGLYLVGAIAVLILIALVGVASAQASTPTLRWCSDNRSHYLDNRGVMVAAGMTTECSFARATGRAFLRRYPSHDASAKFRTRFRLSVRADGSGYDLHCRITDSFLMRGAIRLKVLCVWPDSPVRVEINTI